MNWLTNFVRPKIKALVRKKDIPDNLWVKCPNCAQMIHHKEFKAAQRVCPHCDHHLRIGADERFPWLFDGGDYQEIELPLGISDPLKFRDEKRYVDRIKESRATTGDNDAVRVAHGKIAGVETVVVVQSFKFMGGSMGINVGEAILAAARLAVDKTAPLVIFSAAGGARMQEGILSLMQLPRTTIAIDMVREHRLPFISVITDPTTGGVTASYAMLGDVAIAEPGALIGFAGPRVIENTIRERLPDGFQRSEFLLEHGMLDMVVHRHQLRGRLALLLTLLMNRAMPVEAAEEADAAGAALPSAGDLEIPAPGPEGDLPANAKD